MFTASYVLLWLAGGLYIAVLFPWPVWRPVLSRPLARVPRAGRAGQDGRTGQRLRWAASAATALSWLSLTAALVARGLEAGHWPLTNRYEFAWCFVWSTLLVYLLLELRWGERRCGAAVVGVALLLATYALLQSADEKAIRPLLPALRSIWLQIHVLTAAVGYGACAVGAGLALMDIALSAFASQASGRQASSEDSPRFAERDSSLSWSDQEAIGTEPLRMTPKGHPDLALRADMIERNVERVIGWGFPWLTLGLLTGAIWAQEAWGRYWGWDPKETWTLVIWLWYLVVLHIGGLRKWRGKRTAWLALAGLVIILFAFAGLPWLLRTVRLVSLHGF